MPDSFFLLGFSSVGSHPSYPKGPKYP